MQRVVYIDGIFMMNLIMDFFLLSLTAGILKKTATFLRTLTGSLIGSVGYCLALCLVDLPYYMMVLFFMIPTAMIMVKVGCRTKGVKEVLYGTGYLFTYAFLMGGALLFLRNRLAVFGTNSMIFTVFLGYLGFLVCRRGIQKYAAARENHFCRVIIPGDESHLLICGLIDTGNGLREPVSGRPVAILEKEIWNKMKRWKRPEKFRIIPFHSIGKARGTLEGYEVDHIRIEYENGSKELHGVLIAVFDGRLSSKGRYQMLLPPEWN